MLCHARSRSAVGSTALLQRDHAAWPLHLAQLIGEYIVPIQMIEEIEAAADPEVTTGDAHTRAHSDLRPGSAPIA